MDDGPQIEADLASEPQTEAESDVESTQDEQGPTQNQFVGTSFRAGRDITVSGSKSITNIYQMAPGPPPSDFRRIRMGDLDLRNEIQLVASGEVYREDGRRSVRRVYSARIHGSKAKMTVAVYQGENAEEEWREHISRYSGLRHPNLVQLFGMASACGMHAAIFNDELIPVQQLFKKYSESHLRTVYLWNFLVFLHPMCMVLSCKFPQDGEFEDADNYIRSVSGRGVNSWNWMLWIRTSTGRLCVDPTANDHGGVFLHDLNSDAPSSATVSVLEPPEDSKIVDSISLDRYHEICVFHFEHHHRPSLSMNALVRLDAVILCPPGSGMEHPNEIAYIPDPDINDWGWMAPTRASWTVLENGWTRVDSSEVSNVDIHRQIYAGTYLSTETWLAQANGIFHHLGITSNYDNYLVVQDIIYTITFATGNSIPSGYLFLCPLADLQAEIPPRFRRPECPAYWSLDPTGAGRLSMEDAERLGFPPFELEIRVYGGSWNESVYEGIHQFHQAMGFDPNRQDVALELGDPLWELSAELDGPFAHIREFAVCDDRLETQEAPDSELPQEPVHEESGLPIQSLASFHTAAHQMNYSSAYLQEPAIEETFLDPNHFVSSTPTHHSSSFTFEFSCPSLDQAYHLPPPAPSTLSQFTPLNVPGGSIDHGTGTRQFCEAKGFDPYSQDVARELGFPLFEISTELDGPFAYTQELDVCDDRSKIQNIPDSNLAEKLADGEPGLPAQPMTSCYTAAYQMNYFSAYAQGYAIDESFDSRLVEIAAHNPRSSHDLNFELPFRDQPYPLSPLQPSTPSYFAHPDVAHGIDCGVVSGPSRAQFTTPPASIWSSFPLPPIPVASPPPRPLNPIAAHLDRIPTSGSSKRKFRDDDPADDINIHARRPRKMPKRADL